jgi:hypothetical protein
MRARPFCYGPVQLDLEPSGQVYLSLLDVDADPEPVEAIRQRRLVRNEPVGCQNEAASADLAVCVARSWSPSRPPVQEFRRQSCRYDVSYGTVRPWCSGEVVTRTRARTGP